MKRLAVISDIHGNRWALQSVLADIDRRGVEAIVNLGDCFYGPLDPVGTAEILLDLDIPTVRGNEDRLIVDPPGEQGESPTLRYVKGVLADEHFHWLRSLPLTRVAYEDFHLCHGSLDRDDEYLLWEVGSSGLQPRSADTFESLTERLDEPVLLCAHDHTPRSIAQPDGKLIVNPGSVGLQAYTDDTPISHGMETGSPDARYAVLSRGETGWQVEPVVVPYDWQSAAAVADRNDHADWAFWLRTGRARDQTSR